MPENRKICFVVSSIGTVRSFLDYHIRELSKFYDVYVVANLTEKDYDYVKSLPIKGYKHIEIKRDVKLNYDIRAVVNLKNYFKNENFFAIHSVTPKAGLVAALASKFAGIKNRIHIFTGQIWASRSGFSRFILKQIDKLIVKLNTHILVDGYSQQEFLIENRILKKSNSVVLASGSIAGVNCERFRPNIEYRAEIRSQVGVRDNQTVFVFLGRLTKDKGIDELLAAFSKLNEKYEDTYLLLVGFDEGDYTRLIKENYINLVPKKNFYYYGPTTNSEMLLNAGDVFCLPSYREGFGMSVIESASIGLATIVSDAYGLRDSIVPNVTGLFCKVRSVDSLYDKMTYYMINPEQIKSFGKNGRDFVIKNFDQKVVTEAWVEFYKRALSSICVNDI